MAEREIQVAGRFRFKNAAVFKQVMREEDICRGVIERVTGIEVGSVAYIATEHEEGAIPSKKGMRADAYLVESDGKFYDVEMQIGNYSMLPSRFRGYQSLLDASTLASGREYDSLKESFIVFICDGDPFHRGLPVYKLERTCTNDPRVDFRCRAHWVALNSLAWKKAESEGLRNLLRYVSTDEVAEGDALVNRIDAEVTKVNLRNGGSGMLLDTQTMLEQEARVQGRIQDREEGREEGLAEGRAEGEERYGKLVSLLLDQGRLDDVKRSSADSDLRERLFREFGL